MDLREAATRVPELNVLPIYWAAASLAATSAAHHTEDEFRWLSDLHEMIEEEAERILDEENDDSLTLDQAAATIWRAVSADRQHAAACDLAVQLQELVGE